MEVQVRILFPNIGEIIPGENHQFFASKIVQFYEDFCFLFFDKYHKRIFFRDHLYFGDLDSNPDWTIKNNTDLQKIEASSTYLPNKKIMKLDARYERNKKNLYKNRLKNRGNFYSIWVCNWSLP